TFSEQISEEKTYDDRKGRRLKRTASRQVMADRKQRENATTELRRLHEDAKQLPRQRFVKTDRFFSLMTIAQDKSPTHAHRLAIQLLHRFQSRSSSDEWTKKADRTLRAQLKDRSQQDALSALDPVIAHFDRYKALEETTKNKDFVGLIQLRGILHRIR